MENSKKLEVALYVVGILIIVWSLIDYFPDSGFLQRATVYMIRAVFGCCIVLIGRTISINRNLKNK